MAGQPQGVAIPLVDGKRSSSAFARHVVAEALAEADPVGSAAASRETNWRRRYPEHFRRLVEAGLLEPDAAVGVARRGLEAVRTRMAFEGADGEGLLADAMAAEPAAGYATGLVRGEAEPERELTIPFRGDRLGGDALRSQLDEWVARGSMEPSAADAVREVQEHPEWLSLPGRTAVVLGASSEMGPLRSLLRWGARVAAVDLPKADLWRTTLETAASSAGTLLFPVAPGADSPGRADGSAERSAARPGSAENSGADPEVAGADLLNDLGAVGRWIAGLDGGLVLGNYVYADGVVNLRLSAAVDALTDWLLRAREEVALAFLATPTDVFGVPREVVEFSERAYRAGRVARVLRPAARFVSAGRLLRRNYAPGSDPGLNDSMVLQQGPNYLLAKRIQRWRATAARRDGVEVSMLVAPPTKTRSVLKNRALAAAYAGAHRFGVEAFAPSTSNALMAALLVHDLSTGSRPLDAPWREEAAKAVHGGLWRGPYDPRSALGIAVALGIGRAKS